MVFAECAGTCRINREAGVTCLARLVLYAVNSNVLRPLVKVRSCYVTKVVETKIPQEVRTAENKSNQVASTSGSHKAIH